MSVFAFGWQGALGLVATQFFGVLVLSTIIGAVFGDGSLTMLLLAPPLALILSGLFVLMLAGYVS